MPFLQHCNTLLKPLLVLGLLSGCRSEQAAFQFQPIAPVKSPVQEASRPARQHSSPIATAPIPAPAQSTAGLPPQPARRVLQQPAESLVQRPHRAVLGQRYATARTALQQVRRSRAAFRKAQGTADERKAADIGLLLIYGIGVFAIVSLIGLLIGSTAITIIGLLGIIIPLLILLIG